MPKESPTLTMAKILITSIPYPREELIPYLMPGLYQKQEIVASAAMPMAVLKVKPQRENDETNR